MKRLKIPDQFVKLTKQILEKIIIFNSPNTPINVLPVTCLPAQENTSSSSNFLNRNHSPMEPTKFFSSKGYGRVNNPSESQQESISYSANNHRRRRYIVLAAASFAIFLTVVIAVMVIALVYESATESPEEDEGHPSKSSPSSSSISYNPVESLKIVCSVTQHPDSCISSISSLNNNNNNDPKADPVHFFNLSLAFSFNEVKNLSSLPKELIPKANDKRIESALQDCSSLFENSVSQLNDSAALMKVSPGEKVFTDLKISNLQTWISAAMTDEETCFDGLDEIGGGVSTVGDEVKMKVHKSQEYMSNSLAILNNIQSLLGKFGLPVP